jgi:hypothetical protein
MPHVLVVAEKVSQFNCKLESELNNKCIEISKMLAGFIKYLENYKKK